MAGIVAVEWQRLGWDRLRNEGLSRPAFRRIRCSRRPGPASQPQGFARSKGLRRARHLVVTAALQKARGSASRNERNWGHC